MENRIGKAIALGIRRKNITQRKLAEVAGVSPPTVNQWIAGISAPQWDKLFEIVEYLEIVHDLFPSAKREEQKPNRELLEAIRDFFKTEENKRIAALEQAIIDIKQVTQKNTRDVNKLSAGIERILSRMEEGRPYGYKPEFVKDPTILVIEDDPMQIATIDATMTAEGYNYKIQGENDIQVGMLYVEKNYMHIDLIILDLNLGNDMMNGNRFLNMLRENKYYKHIPVLIYSGDHEKMREILVRKDVNTYKKPFRWSNFKEKLDEIGIRKHNNDEISYYNVGIIGGQEFFNNLKWISFREKIYHIETPEQLERLPFRIHYDLFFIDLDMPNKLGFKAYEQIHKSSSRLCIISNYSTIFAEFRQSVESQTKRFADYEVLRKDCQGRKFTLKIEEILNKTCSSKAQKEKELSLIRSFVLNEK